jgi:hypothetical protein
MKVKREGERARTGMRKRKDKRGGEREHARERRERKYKIHCVWLCVVVGERL